MRSSDASYLFLRSLYYILHMMTGTLFMLIGLPASGKSTWVLAQEFDMKKTVIISTDNIIENWAEQKGKTYDDVWSKELMRKAVKRAHQQLRRAIRHGYDIVWDQTNLDRKGRVAKMADVPAEYYKVAVFFCPPDKRELRRRLAGRLGKTIPSAELSRMFKRMRYPAHDEGFDSILEVGCG